MQYYELTVVMTTWILTLATVVIWVKYINKLLNDMRNGIFIYDDKSHSHKHLWITWVMMSISLLMFFNMIASWEMAYAFFEHLLYNLSCIFIFYPHLMEEK